MRPRGLQQIGNDVIDAGDFLANIFDYRARGAGRRQIAANDFDDAGNPRQWVADFVGQAGGHLAESGKVFGARHLSAVQAFDLDAALAQLPHHLIEVAAQVSNLVVAAGETHRHVEIAAAELRDLLLQFDHGPLHGVGEHDEKRAANGDRACARDQQNDVAFGIAPGERGQQEQQHSAQQNAGDRHQRLDLPIDAKPGQFGILGLGSSWSGIVRDRSSRNRIRQQCCARIGRTVETCARASRASRRDLIRRNVRTRTG